MEVGTLSDDDLLELGAAMEVSLFEARRHARSLRAEYDERARTLLKPALKVGLGLPTAIAGVALTPFTFGWSLILTLVGTGVAVADGVDFGRDTAALLRLRRRVVEATRSAERNTTALARVALEIERRAAGRG